MEKGFCERCFLSDDVKFSNMLDKYTRQEPRKGFSERRSGTERQEREREEGSGKSRTGMPKETERLGTDPHPNPNFLVLIWDGENGSKDGPKNLGALVVQLRLNNPFLKHTQIQEKNCTQILYHFSKRWG
jgi:hypothetical protein